MRGALRRMGNSTGLIVPNLKLRTAGSDNKRINAVPPSAAPRAGWALAAQEIAADSVQEDEAAWWAFVNEEDAAQSTGAASPSVYTGSTRRR